MEYRLNKDQLFEILKAWSGFLKRKVHLIACGGTAMTLAGVKESTKDIDFLVPEPKEYDYLIKTIKQIGYVPTTGCGWSRPGEPFVFDLFPGKRIHVTELLESPLQKGGHVPLVEWSNIYVGILNDHDLIASKLMRGASVDFEDALMLVKAKKKEMDIPALRGHFYELAAYDVAEERVKKHWDSFEKMLKKENLL